MKNYAITEQNLKAVLTYLTSKPYSEVAEAIAVLSSLPEVIDKKEEEKKES